MDDVTNWYNTLQNKLTVPKWTQALEGCSLPKNESGDQGSDHQQPFQLLSSGANLQDHTWSVLESITDLMNQISLSAKSSQNPDQNIYNTVLQFFQTNQDYVTKYYPEYSLSKEPAPQNLGLLPATKTPIKVKNSVLSEKSLEDVLEGAEEKKNELLRTNLHLSNSKKQLEAAQRESDEADEELLKTKESLRSTRLLAEEELGAVGGKKKEIQQLQLRLEAEQAEHQQKMCKVRVELSQLKSRCDEYEFDNADMAKNLQSKKLEVDTLTHLVKSLEKENSRILKEYQAEEQLHSEIVEKKEILEKRRGELMKAASDLGETNGVEAAEVYKEDRSIEALRKRQHTLKAEHDELEEEWKGSNLEMCRVRTKIELATQKIGLLQKLIEENSEEQSGLLKLKEEKEGVLNALVESQKGQETDIANLKRSIRETDSEIDSEREKKRPQTMFEGRERKTGLGQNRDIESVEARAESLLEGQRGTQVEQDPQVASLTVRLSELCKKMEELQASNANVEMVKKAIQDIEAEILQREKQGSQQKESLTKLEFELTKKKKLLNNAIAEEQAAKENYLRTELKLEQTNQKIIGCNDEVAKLKAKSDEAQKEMDAKKKELLILTNQLEKLGSKHEFELQNLSEMKEKIALKKAQNYGEKPGERSVGLLIQDGDTQNALAEDRTKYWKISFYVMLPIMFVYLLHHFGVLK